MTDYSSPAVLASSGHTSPNDHSGSRTAHKNSTMRTYSSPASAIDSTSVSPRSRGQCSESNTRQSSWVTFTNRFHKRRTAAAADMCRRSTTPRSSCPIRVPSSESRRRCHGFGGRRRLGRIGVRSRSTRIVMDELKYRSIEV